ncbi:hypothetical protein DKX38_007521 [Salix brachista]|uniref:superoxide dismutase n=1 Tax=Salix brachista TaxID=2182728 RepID=A0A5N5MNI7_9ROSI|nr:hypothetical protein DKX38_007521 [Salix brachista]
MGCFSYYLFPSSPTCQVPVTGSFACQFKTTPYKQLPTLFKQKKKQFNGFQRASRVVSYYALKTPPYKLVSDLFSPDSLEPYMSKRTVEVHWKGHHGAYVEGLNKALAKSDILYGYTLDDLVKVTYNNGNPSPDFNNAAQVWNHDFFWESMQPGGGDMPELGMLEQIEKDFGSFTNFRDKFAETALTLFGSGWVWLVYRVVSVLIRRSFDLKPSIFLKGYLKRNSDDTRGINFVLVVAKYYAPFSSEYYLAYHIPKKTTYCECVRTLKREERRLEVVKTQNAVTPIVWGDIPIINLDMWEHAYYLDYKNDKENYVNAFMDHLVSWNMAMARLAHAEAFVNLGIDFSIIRKLSSLKQILGDMKSEVSGLMMLAAVPFQV